MSHALVARCCVVFAVSLLTSCARTPGAPKEKTRPLPEVAAGDTNFSQYQPAKPYIGEAQGGFTRTVFEAQGPPGFQVEVRDVMIAPGKKAEPRWPGAAFLEVRGGAGTLVVDGKKQELAQGATVAIAQGQALTLEATAGQPLTLRVQLLKAQ